MPLLIALFLSFTVAANREIEDAKASIESLIAPLVPHSKTSKSLPKNGFRVDKCEKKKINWFNVMTMKEEVTLNFKFAPGCDIEGSFKPKIFSPFPVTLTLRHIKSFNKMTSENRITAGLENPPLLNLTITGGELHGQKSKVKFEADYKLRINPLNPTGIEKNLGGELRIHEINGKKVSIKEKIYIK